MRQSVVWVFCVVQGAVSGLEYFPVRRGDEVLCEGGSV